MPLPTLEIGLIVQYEYLWHRRRDAPTADKDRPACVVVTFKRPKAGTISALQSEMPPSDAGDWDDYVVYLPISHTPPGADQTGIALTASECRRAGLDERPQWVMVSECNIDIWPEDVRTLPNQAGRFHYGIMPPNTFERIKQAFLDHHRSRRLRSVSRHT